MSSSDVNKKVAYSIVRHLQSQVSVGALGEDEADGIDVAVQCICQAYGLDLMNEADSQLYAIRPTLHELVAGVAQEVSDEDKSTAESYKQQGNVHLKANRVAEAMECYTRAVAIDPTNAMFYCNRAATYIKLNQPDLAITDCKKALSLNPNYARAHGRLGFIYSSQGQLELSKNCFQKAIQLDPSNENYRTNLQTVEDQIRGASLPTQPPLVPPSSSQDGVAGGGGGGGGANSGAGLEGVLGSGMAGLLQNPGFMNMATTLMQNPTFQNMASRMMSRGVMTPNEVTPEVISEVSQAAREMQQSNPNVLESLQRHVFQGMVAQNQQQHAPGGGGADDQVGSGGTEDGGTKSSAETKDGPSSADTDD